MEKSEIYLETIKEIHAARLKIQDETAGMTTAERSAYHKLCAADLFSSLGLPSP